MNKRRIVILSNTKRGKEYASQISSYADVMLFDKGEIRIEEITGWLGNLRLTINYLGKIEEIRCDAVVIENAKERILVHEGVPQSEFGKIPVEQLSGKSVVVLHDGLDSVQALENSLRASKYANLYFLSDGIDCKGKDEKIYEECSRSGVRFFRCKITDLKFDINSLQIFDKVLGEHIIISYDILVVDDERKKIILPKNIQIPNDYEKYAWIAENRIINRSGIFRLGDFSQDIAIPDIFSTSELPSAYLVDENSCRLCLNCMRVCPFGIPKFGSSGKSYIEKNLCNGCGVCASECPAKAIKRDKE
ncbi:MAG: 4Fe-4S binding protein [Thermoplasmata archaeon]